jgi:hypothetical protein
MIRKRNECKNNDFNDARFSLVSPHMPLVRKHWIPSAKFIYNECTDCCNYYHCVFRIWGKCINIIKYLLFFLHFLTFYVKLQYAVYYTYILLLYFTYYFLYVHKNVQSVVLLRKVWTTLPCQLVSYNPAEHYKTRSFHE